MWESDREPVIVWHDDDDDDVMLMARYVDYDTESKKDIYSVFVATAKKENDP